MQLSAPTPSADSPLAALFVAAGRSTPTDASLIDPGLTTGEGSVPGFAAVLQGAEPAPTPTPNPAVVPELTLPTPAPSAATTRANFPSWLTADAIAAAPGTPKNVEMTSAQESALTDDAGGVVTSEGPLAGAVGIAIEENANSSPIGANAGGKPASPGKTGRAGKSPEKSSSPAARPVASRSAPTTEAAAIPTVTPSSVSISLPGTDEAQPQTDAETPSAPAKFSSAASPALLRQAGQGYAAKAAAGAGQGGKSNSASTVRSGSPAQPVGASDDSVASGIETGSDFASLAPEASSDAGDQAAHASVPHHAKVEAALPLSPTTSREAFSAPREPSAAVARREMISASAGESQREAATAAATNDVPSTALFAELAPEMTTTVEVSTTDVRESSADENPRTIDFENTIPTRAEIFAALGENSPAGKRITNNASDKTFLNTSNKRVATREPSLGTDVAKSEATMPATTFAQRPTFVAPPERTASASFETAVASPVSFLSSQPAVVAHRAVDAVMTAAERFSTGDRHSVHLQFSVGGADLSVRVEMRGDEVRTTFRTDSPELRNALAREWQAAAPDSADRAVKIVAPVFSSNDRGDFSAFSGDTSSRQQNARARRDEADDVFAAVASRSRAGATFAAAAHELTAPAARAASSNALHLSTLA